MTVWPKGSPLCAPEARAINADWTDEGRFYFLANCPKEYAGLILASSAAMMQLPEGAYAAAELPPNDPQAFPQKEVRAFEAIEMRGVGGDYQIPFVVAVVHRGDESSVIPLNLLWSTELTVDFKGKRVSWIAPSRSEHLSRAVAFISLPISFDGELWRLREDYLDMKKGTIIREMNGFSLSRLSPDKPTAELSSLLREFRLKTFPAKSWEVRYSLPRESEIRETRVERTPSRRTP